MRQFCGRSRQLCILRFYDKGNLVARDHIVEAVVEAGRDMDVRNPTVLLTGATGFYGRHVLPFLRARGWEPVVVTRRPVALDANVNVIPVADIGGKIDWPRYLDGVKAVVHLAGLAHPASFVSEDEFDRVNRQATIRIARATQRAGARFIYISSIAAQAGSKVKGVLIESNSYEPKTAYGRSKARAEQEVAEIGGRYVIFRPALTYGAGVGGNMRRLIELATAKIPPPFGALHNRRSLLAMENACEAFDFVLRTDAALGQTFLLADPEPLSVAEIVRALREGAGISGGGIRMPPALLALALRTLGRFDVWDKIGGELVVSVERLKQCGFRWKVDTRSGLRALGATLVQPRLEV